MCFSGGFRSALNYTLAQPLPLQRPFVITVCTCVRDNWPFHKRRNYAAIIFFIWSRSWAWFLCFYLKASLWVWALAEAAVMPGANSKELRNKAFVWRKHEWHSLHMDLAEKWMGEKRATITLGWLASKQVNFLWTMNIAYCSQNCCCLDFIKQQIWFTQLDRHFRRSWILITFLSRDM